VSEERRQHQRSSRAVDGSWRGASGGTPCRISDLSVAGCFVQSMATPLQGESTTITLSLDGRSVSVSGTVLYIEAGMGFAVRFADIPADIRAAFGARGTSAEPAS
jgi:hypothetical protein